MKKLTRRELRGLISEAVGESAPFPHGLNVGDRVNVWEAGGPFTDGMMGDADDVGVVVEFGNGEEFAGFEWVGPGKSEFADIHGNDVAVERVHG